MQKWEDEGCPPDKVPIDGTPSQPMVSAAFGVLLCRTTLMPLSCCAYPGRKYECPGKNLIVFATTCTDWVGDIGRPRVLPIRGRCPCCSLRLGPATCLSPGLLHHVYPQYLLDSPTRPRLSHILSIVIPPKFKPTLMHPTNDTSHPCHFLFHVELLGLCGLAHDTHTCSFDSVVIFCPMICIHAEYLYPHDLHSLHLGSHIVIGGTHTPLYTPNDSA